MIISPPGKEWWDRFGNKNDYLRFMTAINNVTRNDNYNGLVNTINMYAELGVIRDLWSAMEVHGMSYASDLLRVSIRDSGNFDIVDFTTPRRAGKVLHENTPQESVPQWVIEAVSMLRIADANSTVDGVGFKLSDRVYYIVDRREGNGNQED